MWLLPQGSLSGGAEHNQRSREWNDRFMSTIINANNRQASLEPLINSNLTSQLDHCSEKINSSYFVLIMVTHMSLALALLGLPANLLTLAILRVDNTKGVTRFLLMALAIEDIGIIVFYTLYYTAANYHTGYQIAFLGYLQFAESPLFFMVNWVKMTEIFTVVLFSLERFCAIQWPLKSSRLCSPGRAKRALIGIGVVSALIKLPNLIVGYRHVEQDRDCSRMVMYRVFACHNWFPWYEVIHVQIIDQVCSYLIPLSLLVILNTGLIIKLRRVEKTRRSSLISGLLSVNKNIESTKRMSERQASQLTDKQTSNERSKETKQISNPADILKQRKINAPLPHSSKLCSCLSTELSSQRGIEENCQSWRIKSTAFYGPFLTRNRTNANLSVTVSLVGVVTTFLICETPTTICFCYDLYKLVAKTGRPEMEMRCKQNTTNANQNSRDASHPELEAIYDYIYTCALVLILFGCASNFFIYILVGRRFRLLCMQLFSRQSKTLQSTSRPSTHSKQ